MRHLIQRLIHMAIVLLIVTIGTFLLIDMLPGDPAVALLGETATPEQVEVVRDQLGLDDPIPVRYVQWLGDVAQGDLGTSFRTKQPVWDNLANRVPVSLELMFLAQLVSLVLAIPIGIYTAFRPGRAFDKTSMAVGFGLVSLAPFILALLLILLFAGKLGWFPSTGFVRWTENPFENIKSLVLPTMTLALTQVAVYQQLLRSDMITTLQSDYIMMAKSKGLSTRHILVRHALRPSSFSLVTLTGVNVGRLIGGSVIVEVIFGIPGIGQMLVQSIYNRDFIVLQGALLFTATAYVLVNMSVDVMYTFLDPRVQDE